MSVVKPTSILVLVVDDHELTRVSLKLTLMSEQDVEVVGLASNGEEAIALVERHSPDVVIMDLQMPVMDGLSAACEIKKLNRHTQIIAYSSLKDPQTEVMSQTAPIDLLHQKNVSSEILVESVLRLGRRSQQLNQAFCQRFNQP